MSALSQQLEELKLAMADRLPQEIRDKFAAATEALKNTGIEDTMAHPGEQFPDFSLPDATGKQVSLDELIEEGPLVVTFYRGSWCPYCNLELRAYQDLMGEITERDARLVAISPQKPDQSLSAKEKEGLSFDVLSDTDNRLAEALGIMFPLAEELRSIYANFDLNLPDINDVDNWNLPLPATFVVGMDKTIEWVSADADYTNRPDPSEVLNHL